MRIRKNWPAAAAALLGLAAVAITTPAGAKDWKAVRVGTDATYPPFESVNPKGEIVGWEIDYAKALCEHMKITCTFQNQDWDGIIPALLAGKFDVIISSMNVTPPRAEKVAFSDVYYSTPPAFMGPASEKSNDVSPEKLKGKTIGAQSSAWPGRRRSPRTRAWDGAPSWAPGGSVSPKTSERTTRSRARSWSGG